MPVIAHLCRFPRRAAWLSLASLLIVSFSSPIQAQTSTQTKSNNSRPPSDASAVFQILASEIALQQGQPGVAIATYIALAERTKDPAVAERATRLALSARAPRQALRAGAIWLDVTPDSPEAQDIVDGLRIQLGLFQDLRANLLQRKSLIRNPKALINFYERLAGLASQGPDPAKSLALIESVAQNDLSHPSLLYARAMLHEKMADYNAMEALLRQLIASQPDYAHAYNALGYSLADRGERLQEALTLIEKAHQLLPEDPHILDSLGWVHFRKGNLNDAKKWLSDAHRRQPDAEISAHLGEVLWRLTLPEEALAVFRLGLSHDPTSEVLMRTLDRLGITRESLSEPGQLR